MSTEKTIKLQAKSLLKGNWSTIISATIFLCVIPITIFTLSDFICVLCGVYDKNGEISQNMSIVYGLITSFAYVILLFCSPIANGLIKICCNTAFGRNAQMSDLFFYFKSISNYFITLIFNTIILAFAITLSYGLDVYHFIALLTDCTLEGAINFSIQQILLLAALIITVIIKLFIYFIFVHYPLIAYSTFENMPITKCVFSMYIFSLRHLKQTIKLAFGFIGWAALCFFVVPAFYVLPYAMTSACVSAKWLFKLDFDKGVLC